ncbi:MAG: beta-propeller fold lactonase family protein [Acidobacteria bacterium]|nr:beta-propeller fold lactonase family protein [Acidobacteriota bacterium]NIM61909.1 beta-propeller fold lactonase family protein [Acidobacteriota bacterium]NIO59679.1 beta-propeller fold lactonase family protein [Acidobacteriota bacterium]NIQ30774.1 beta-propeller fold lactonase family protein [Acidobacteriota bacterium]NIQ85801.1 beta-propeller fold lactonase family protein [Acidobacteriota bacterium]
MSCRRPSFLLFAILLLAASAAAADTLLVANKTDHTVDLVDPRTGESRATLPTGEFPHEIAVDPDGRLAAISNYGNRGAPGNSITVIDLAAREVVRTIDLGDNTRPHGMVWTEKRLIVTTEGSKKLLVVDPADGRVVHGIATDQEISHMVAVTPDGSRAFVGNIGSGSVTVIDLAAGRKIKDIETGAGAEGLTVTPDGEEVWVGNRGADTLTVIDAKSLEILEQVPCKGVPIRVVSTGDGKRILVSCARTGEVAAFDREQRKELVRRKLDLSTVPDAASRLFGDRFGESPVPVGLVISPDDRKAWVAATQSDVVVVVDVVTLDVLDLIRTGREPDGMAYTSDD